jgi:methyltransferase (TIGR00027 family)
MDPVGLTSRWVAAARARESERLDRLFDDPLAAALAGSEGFAWLDHMERAQPWGGPALYVVVRTRFFDDFLLRASWGTGARQVVLLAAGMDARAFRLNWPPGTRLYELDRPEVIDAKDAIASSAGAHPTCERWAIGVDLGRPSWPEALLSADEYEAQEPSVWLAEGLLFYMTEATTRTLLGGASALAAQQEPPDLTSDVAVARDLLPPRCSRPLRHQLPGGAVCRARLGGEGDPTRRERSELRAVALPGGASADAGRPSALPR